MDGQKVKKKERLAALLSDTASSFIRFEVDPQAIVTITRTEVSENAHSVKFFISVFPDAKEKQIVTALNKKGPEFREYLKTKARLRILPTVYFEIDKGWKLGLKIDKLA